MIFFISLMLVPWLGHNENRKWQTIFNCSKGLKEDPVVCWELIGKTKNLKNELKNTLERTKRVYEDMEISGT